MFKSLPLLLVYSLITATPVIAVLASRVEHSTPHLAVAARAVPANAPVERIVVTCKRDELSVKPG